MNTVPADDARGNPWVYAGTGDEYTASSLGPDGAPAPLAAC